MRRFRSVILIFVSLVVVFFYISVVYALPTDINSGRSLYEANCSSCHGVDAKGGISGNIIGESTRNIEYAFRNAIRMKFIGMGLSRKDVNKIAKYLKSLK